MCLPDYEAILHTHPQADEEGIVSREQNQHVYEMRRRAMVSQSLSMHMHVHRKTDLSYRLETE